MKTRKTLLKYIGELANRGFLNSQEFKNIENKINNYYNAWGLK